MTEEDEFNMLMENNERIAADMASESITLRCGSGYLTLGGQSHPVATGTLTSSIEKKTTITFTCTPDKIIEVIDLIHDGEMYYRATVDLTREEFERLKDEKYKL